LCRRARRVTFWVSVGISVEVEVLVEGELGMRVVKFRRGVSVVEMRRWKRVQWELGYEEGYNEKIEELTSPGLRLVQRQFSIVVSSEVL
jgi:hypothetical protein